VAGPIFALAGATLFLHNAMMAEEHPFTITIEPYARDQGLFRWTIMESGKERNFSGRAYRSRAEAEADAHAKMQELIKAALCSNLTNHFYAIQPCGWLRGCRFV
jgi:hypothetical protein